MSQLTTLKSLLGGSPQQSDEILQFYLDNAGDIICDIRNSDIVEKQYLNLQIRIALELVSKMGAEGEISHSENGISRTYEKADVSESLLSKIIPVIKTPFSTVRVVD